MPIELINTTPWDTEELIKFLEPLCADTGIATLKVSLLTAQPGEKRKDQPLYDVAGIDPYKLKEGKLPTKATVWIISPKRVAARTDVLHRMSQVDDLDPHEIALPEAIIGGISHSFERLSQVCQKIRAGRRHTLASLNDPWEFNKHFQGNPHRCCKCSKTLDSYPLIRGNTRTRTTKPVDIKRLKRRGRWALEAAEKYREKMEKQLALAERLGRRIRKIEGRD